MRVESQAYDPGIERARVTAEFLKGLEDENAKRRRDALESTALIGAAILAWKVYRHHSGKRP
jgi:hypothetical protein